MSTRQTIAVAVAEGGRGGEVRELGDLLEPPRSLEKLVARLGRAIGVVSFCYEAGPCGYGLYRQLIGLGHDCIVVAPSLIPMKAGDRVKTDRRDAMMLAKLHRAGELTAVWVPDDAHEAMRDLIRARATAVRVLAKARQHLQGFLLRHGRVYAGKKGWTQAYRRWLTTVRFDHPPSRWCCRTISMLSRTPRRGSSRLIAPDRGSGARAGRMAPVVEALQAMRGVAFIVAVTVVAEVGDFSRFTNPRQLMAYLGLVPSEHSSGSTVRRAESPRPGNALARRVLIEGAWTYRMQPASAASCTIASRLCPQVVRDIAWKAQVRLCARYRRLAAAGKPKVVVTTAIAREMVGFIWAIARHRPGHSSSHRS